MRKYLTVSELAWELNRSVWYVYAMRKDGFQMPGGTATVEEAKEWLKNNTGFVAIKVMRAKKRKEIGPRMRQL